MLMATPSSMLLFKLAASPSHDIPRLVNPYVQPMLYVRRPGDDHEQMYTFPDDDPFFSEVSGGILKMNPGQTSI
jgi:hypothetical protein